MDMEKYLTKLASEKYRNTLQLLKEFIPDETKTYQIVYRTKTQRKDRSEYFEKVVFVEEQSAFLFDDRLPISMADVIEVIEGEKFDAEKYIESMKRAHSINI